ncbi:MAG: hypothetical protein M0Z89_06120 [Nitrospiraceae bacterium]|nr:hypothetical protein [Nitrospiraceae bacterium]
MKTLLSSFFCMILLFAGSFAFADTAADLTEVYTDSGMPGLAYTTPSGVHGIIGAGLFNGERIIGDTRRRTALLPIVLMTYQDWAYRPDDNPDLAGMEPRSTSLDGFVNGLWKTPVVNVGVRFYHDIGHVSRGDSLTLWPIHARDGRFCRC